jgi:cytochrome P450
MAVPFEERLALQRESRAYMAELVARARVEQGEDILGTLVREHGAELTDAELVGMASLLMIAGHETTSNMLSLGTLALLRHPEQLAMIRDDAANVDAAIEELLRWLSPTHGVHRVTTTEVEIGGHTIPAGEPVVLVLPTANRDPAVVPDAGRLDISRGPAGHFAFGHGVHYCLGAPLARMEMRIAFPALLRRFPNLALAVPYDEIAFRDFHFVHGLRALPVTW